MNEFLILIVIGLKILLPVLMIRFPFQAIWSNYFLDTVDGDVLQFLGLNDATYQIIDKGADYWSYIFMLAVGWKWPIRKILIILFLYRSIGQLLFFITKQEIVFFYFQNLLEPLLLIYTLLIFTRGGIMKAHTTYKKHMILIWAIIIGYKLWNEWYLHLANIDLSTLFFGIDGAD